MTTIYKYRLAIESSIEIKMPYASKPIHAGLDPSGDPCVWAIVNTDNPIHERTFHVCGTGNPLTQAERDGRHIGSFQQGPFMWHVFA